MLKLCRLLAWYNNKYTFLPSCNTIVKLSMMYESQAQDNHLVVYLIPRLSTWTDLDTETLPKHKMKSLRQRISDIRYMQRTNIRNHAILTTMWPKSCQKCHNTHHHINPPKTSAAYIHVFCSGGISRYTLNT